MNGRVLAFIAASVATLIYGANYTIAKDVMPAFVKPFGFIVLRVFGAMVLFWLLSLFVKREKIAKKDFIAIFFAAVFGAGFNMLTFFKGLNLTTPIDASVIMVLTPIIVFVLSILFLKERIISHRIAGVIIGLIGALVLIVYGTSTGLNAPNIFLGNIYVILNATFYGIYLIIIKKLMAKYHPINLIKWVYLFGLFIVLPFGFQEFSEINWTSMPNVIVYKVLYVVVFATFTVYLCNLIALTKLKATTVGAFIYLQPVAATIFALLLGSDKLNTVKLIASAIIFVGVYLVSKRSKEIV